MILWIWYSSSGSLAIFLNYRFERTKFQICPYLFELFICRKINKCIEYWHSDAGLMVFALVVLCFGTNFLSWYDVVVNTWILLKAICFSFECAFCGGFCSKEKYRVKLVHGPDHTHLMDDESNIQNMCLGWWLTYRRRQPLKNGTSNYHVEIAW